MGGSVMASIINAGQTALTVTPDTTGALTIQANGTSAIAIDNTQRVGLGTTTPNTKLHVTGAGSGIFGVYDDVAKFKGTSYTYIHLDGTNNQSGMVISANTDKGWFVGNDNSQGLKIARMTSLNQDGISNAKDSGTPSLVLDASGNVGIGTGSPSQKLHVDGGSGMSSSALIARFFGTSGNSMLIRGSGNVENTNGAFGTISDVKLKENIVDATPKLDKVNQLKVRNYNLIGDNLKQIGFVAQEIEQVFPGIVSENPDLDEKGNDLGTTTKTVKTTVLIPILVKAIQEQQAIISDLKARIEVLENK